MTPRLSLLAPLALLALGVLPACTVDGDGDGSAAQFDCDDTNPAILPGADELCDGLDNDCDGLVDEDTVDAPTFYQDFDRDGFGDPETTTTECRYSDDDDGPDPEFEPVGFVRNSDDCDDAFNTINPDADERCDGVDNDCDGEIDEADAVDPLTWYADTDDDGFGDADDTQEACDQPDGYVLDATDCDDTTDTVNPGLDEVCDGADNDCDETIDEPDAVDAPTWYADTDGDTYGDPATATPSCDQPTGFVADATDCNDDAATAFPGGTEVCDGLDNDCDATTSEASTLSLNATTATYTTITEMLEAASDGDTLYICEGTWTEDLSVTTSVTLLGPSGAEATILQGTGDRRVVSLGSNDYRIEGLTIQGGRTEEGDGGGINAIDADSLELVSVVIQDNLADDGGGLMGPTPGTLLIEDSLFRDNRALDNGGGAVLFDGTVRDTRFLDNEARFGGGLTEARGSLTLERVRVISNYASFGGGGLAILDGGEVDGGEFLNNLSDDAGGGAILDGTLRNATLRNNRSTDTGGGIYVESPSTIDGVTIEANRAPLGGGLAVETSFLSVINTDIIDNEASATGGGVWLDGSADFETTTFERNTAATAGGGVHLVSGELESVRCDWGTGMDDNDPDDIYADASATSYDAYGAGETFTCDTAGDCL